MGREARSCKIRSIPLSFENRSGVIYSRSLGAVQYRFRCLFVEREVVLDNCIFILQTGLIALLASRILANKSEKEDFSRLQTPSAD